MRCLRWLVAALMSLVACVHFCCLPLIINYFHVEYKVDAQYREAWDFCQFSANVLLLIGSVVLTIFAVFWAADERT